MSINLDPNLISNFRDTVNDQPIFRQLFRNLDGKNKWNIICSAMDWITVTAEGLPLINLESPTFGYNHLASLNLMQYIVTVDLLMESIIQLYRVIGGEKSYPLSNDQTVFKQSKINDDTYFKHIRAVFGTHPVNLTSLDGYNKNDGERFYASWSTGKIIDSDADFNAVLYSNKSENDDFTFFGVKISEVNKYAEKRYNLIYDLIEKVKQINDQNDANNKEKKIPSVTDPIKQLEILMEENNSRIGAGYGYSFEINTLYCLLKINVSPEAKSDILIINEYRDYLLSLIPSIINDLEAMDIQGINLWSKLARGYEFEKIYSYLNDHQHPIGEQYFKELIQKKWLPSYLLYCNDFDEKNLILNAYLHRAEKNGVAKFGCG